MLNLKKSKELRFKIVYFWSHLTWNVPDAHAELWIAVQSEVQMVREQQLNSKFDSVFNKFDQLHQRVIRRAKDMKLSSWLTVVPAAKSRVSGCTCNPLQKTTIVYSRHVMAVVHLLTFLMHYHVRRVA